MTFTDIEENCTSKCVSLLGFCLKLILSRSSTRMQLEAIRKKHKEECKKGKEKYKAKKEKK